MYKAIYEEAQAMQEELAAWRHALHAMPEIGLDLPQTTAYVRARLEEMDVPYQTLLDGSAIVAQLGQGETCLLLRADMDALPVREESGESFAATNGNMHACGHDMHTASLLGAAKLLKRHESELRGRVKLFFQPAEEKALGAKLAVESGLLDHPRVDAAVATHVFSTLPVGAVAYGEYACAGVYGFQITLTGKGTHGAMPQEGIDPINTGVHIYLALQELIARECAPDQEVSLTVGHFEAGSALNVIPQTAFLEGTLRAFDEDVRQHFMQRIQEVVTHVAAAYRTEVQMDTFCDIVALHCDNTLNHRFAEAYQAMDAALEVTPTAHFTGSEDFAYIAEEVPSAFYAIGAQTDDEARVVAQHNPHVLFNDKALSIETAVYTVAALRWQRDAE